MRRHEVSRAHKTTTLSSDKTEKEGRQQNKRLSAHQSATSATQDLNRFSILCDSQKYTASLDVHHSACLKHCNFSTDQKHSVATAREQGLKQLRFQHGPFTKRFGSVVTGILVTVLPISTHQCVLSSNFGADVLRP